jgi:hypothetical protein
MTEFSIEDKEEDGALDTHNLFVEKSFKLMEPIY